MDTFTIYVDGDPSLIRADDKAAAITAATILWVQQLWGDAALTVVRDEDGAVIWKDGITL